MNSLTRFEEHFAFGKNWESFRRVVTAERIAAAENGLTKLFPDGALRDADVLDIGCGSGLSALAALNLGAARVEGIDIDPDCVEAARALLSANAVAGCWSVRRQSVFDLSPPPAYDVVHSWGVLHHTGDMWKAVRVAAALVKPGGYFAIALYRKTRWCGFWVREKRFYARAPSWVQSLARGVYKSAAILMMFKNGVNPRETISGYARRRGMSWSHDIHDWLGGYPYESASADAVRACLADLEFDIVREFVGDASGGLLGSGCDEFVARRQT